MWEYLASLPTFFSFSIVILGVIAIVIISLKGSAVFKWGKNLVGLGGAKIPQDSDDPSKNGTSVSGNTSVMLPNPPPTVILRPTKRSCGDCILIIMSEREKYELRMSSIQDRVLKNQMNFFEQKVVEIQDLIEKVFSDAMSSTKIQNIVGTNVKNTDLEYRFFTELLRDSLVSVKNEIRRSYKDNGYFEMVDSEFSTYIKDKSRLVMNVITQHIKNMYPTQGVTVPLSDIIIGVNFKLSSMSDIIRECFEYSKEVTIDSKNQVEEFKREFSTWADNFVSPE